MARGQWYTGVYVWAQAGCVPVKKMKGKEGKEQQIMETRVLTLSELGVVLRLRGEEEALAAKQSGRGYLRGEFSQEGDCFVM